MFNHQPFFLFILVAGYVSFPSRAYALQPFSSKYRPFDMIFLDDDDIYDGTLGSGIDLNLRLKEHPLNVTSELKVHDGKSSNKFEKGVEPIIYDNPKVTEHSANPLESNVKLNIIDIDDLGMVSDKEPIFPSTNYNTVPRNSKPLEDVPDDFITGFFKSVACMIQGIMDILFGQLPPKTNTSKETVRTEDDLTPKRKVHKREIISSDTTVKITSSTESDHDNTVQSSLSNVESINNKPTIDSPAAKATIGKTDLMDETLLDTLDRIHLGDKSSSIAHVDKVTEHNSNNTKTDPESTSHTPTTFSKVLFVTLAKENNLVKNKPDMLLDDHFPTQDDPELLDDAIKMADYNSRDLQPAAGRNIDVKSSTIGEIVLITSACVFFVLVFAIGGAALAYMVRQKHLAGNPFGNPTASGRHNTNLVHA